MEDENFVAPLLSKLKYLSQLLNSLNSLEISQLDELDMRQQSNDDNYLHDANYSREPGKHVSFDDEKDDFGLLNTQQQAEKNISMANTTDASLVDETLQLLNQATFIRVFIDELMWRKIPDFFTDDFKRRNHCNGSFAVRYSVPLFEKNSDRAYDRIITARSREILPSVVGFNHRHVSLLIVSPALLQHWAEAYLSFCIYYKSSRKQESIIAKCSFPLCKLLVLPFAVEASLPLEMHCFGSASGILKYPTTAVYVTYCQVTVLIGSRNASFTERVEPLRNPTTMKLKSMSFLDTLTTTKPGVGALNRQLKAAERSRGRKSGTANDGSSLSPFVERHIVGRRDLTLPLDVPDEESLLSDQYDEIRFNRSHLQPFQSPLSDAGIAAVQSGNSVSTECIECHVDNLLKRRAFANIPVSAKSRSVGVQTETVLDLTYDQHYSKTGNKFDQKIQADVQCSKWDAWKWPIRARQCPMFLRLIVHQARYLPAVNGNGDVATVEGQHMQPPSAFVSYRIDNRMIKSEVAPASFHPRWDWKTELKLMPEQRTIVFHIWHKSSVDEQSELLLGAVSVDVAQVVMSSIRSTWWFDIIDLRAGSPGQLQLTIEALEPASEKDEESLYESFLKGVTSTSMDTPAASRSILAETLKEKLCELDNLMEKIIPPK
ncbi:hypothetical protein T4A_3494 [Trichinella pseudospiralis]|uniref:C2 domain-containing protein n=1 Tax=Trichinella pseudospiralis TaxID=6337 RepID=A0A0V1EUD9_TRIPS|nr:hypothetical protein T4A_3494 [Trichinella pseudospiralis]